MTTCGKFYLESAKLLHPQSQSDEEAHIILEEAADTPGPVVDLGCGHGRHLYGLRNSGRLVVGVELEPTAAHLAMQKAPVIQADFTCLPFPGATFAVAYAWCNAFGTLPESEFRPFFREVSRILQPGGLFIIQGTDCDEASELPTDPVTVTFPEGQTITEERAYDPTSRRDRLRRWYSDTRAHYSGELSVRYFNRKELAEMLAKHGFALKSYHTYAMGFVGSFRKMM